jgi:hypothetical protein
MALRLALAALAAFVLGAGAAWAQTLQHLTVTQLTLATDTATPRVEEPFHLVVTAHVRERVSRLENLDLPILAELELLGDEHTLASDAGGTTYRETITVVAHHSGKTTIAPVTLDAINARTGRAERYSSNSLTLDVGGMPLVPQPAPAARSWLANALIVGGFTLVAVAGMALVARRWSSGAPSAPPEIVLPPAQPVPPRDPRAELREALAMLRTQRTRATAVGVRAFVRRMVGASDAETLDDVLRRPNVTDPLMRELLRALERAAFTYDGDLGPAIDAAIVALERAAA